MLAHKQDVLKSGANIKKINGLSILGPGNLVINPGSKVDVDMQLSATSNNPVANKIITNALAAKAPAGKYVKTVNQLEPDENGDVEIRVVAAGLPPIKATATTVESNQPATATVEQTDELISITFAIPISSTFLFTYFFIFI